MNHLAKPLVEKYFQWYAKAHSESQGYFCISVASHCELLISFTSVRCQNHNPIIFISFIVIWEWWVMLNDSISHVILAKISYFTNMDISEMTGFPFLSSLLGWGRSVLESFGGLLSRCNGRMKYFGRWMISQLSVTLKIKNNSYN